MLLLLQSFQEETAWRKKSWSSVSPPPLLGITLPSWSKIFSSLHTLLVTDTAFSQLPASVSVPSFIKDWSWIAVFLCANLGYFIIHVSDLVTQLLNFLTLLAVQFQPSTHLPRILYLLEFQKSKHESISLMTSLLHTSFSTSQRPPALDLNISCFFCLSLFLSINPDPLVFLHLFQRFSTYHCCFLTETFVTPLWIP